MSEELEIGLTRLAADDVPAALETVQSKVLEQVAGLRATAPQLAQESGSLPSWVRC